MILPHTISDNADQRTTTFIPSDARVHLPQMMQNDEYGQPMHHFTPISSSPIHTFNEMETIYYNLASRQVPNTYQDYDPLADIKRREKEILKEREYREHELRMEYEKRLEEFEADYRLKDQELEREKLYQEKLLIEEREREIDYERK